MISSPLGSETGEILEGIVRDLPTESVQDGAAQHPHR